MNVSRPCLRTPLHGNNSRRFGAGRFMPDATSANAQSNWNLDRLMATLAQNKSGRARFVETKYLAIAAQPVESSGELVFVAPDHLEQRTTSPKPEDLVVDGDKLTVDRNDHKYTLALANYPATGRVHREHSWNLVRQPLCAEQAYKVTVTGHGDDWSMTLVPIESQMLKVVSTITLAGTRDTLHSVTISQADGDHSVMKLQRYRRIDARRGSRHRPIAAAARGTGVAAVPPWLRACHQPRKPSPPTCPRSCRAPRTRNSACWSTSCAMGLCRG